MEENNKNNKSRKIIKNILIAFGFLVILCILVSILIGKDSANETSIDPNAVFTQVAETVICSMTQTAGSDPSFIHTQVAGTMMAEAAAPTETPSQEPAPVRSQDDVLLEYINDSIFKSDGCGSSLTDLNSMNMELAEDYYLLYDYEWIADLEEALIMAEAYCTTLGWESGVPAGYEEVNNYLLLANEEFSKSFVLYRQGINNIDANAISQSTAHMEVANSYLNMAIEVFPQ